MEIYLVPAGMIEWLDRRGKLDTSQRVHLGYFLSGALVLVLLPLIPFLPHFCLMQALLGIPCPGCGVTHAVLLALSLRLRDSVMANPAGVVIVATVGFQLLGRPLAIVDGRASLFVTRASRWLGRFSVVALFAAWFSTLIQISVLSTLTNYQF